METTVNMISMNMEGNDDDHLKQMKEQIEILISKIKNHKTYQMIKGEDIEHEEI